MDYKAFTARLRAAREKKNLNQRELSLRADLDHRACGHLESQPSDRNTGVVTLEKLARALDVSPGWLAFGEDDAQARIEQLLGRAAQGATPPPSCQAAGMADDLEDEEPPEDEEDSDEEEYEYNAWPWGYRTSYPRYLALPPLGPAYRPVLVALGATMPALMRRQVSTALLLLLTDPDPARLASRARDIGMTLSRLIAPSGYPILEQVVQVLASPDRQTRGMMALSLLVDAGLPVTLPELDSARDLPDISEELDQALFEAMEMIERWDWRDRRDLRHPFMEVLEHYALYEGGWRSMHPSP